MRPPLEILKLGRFGLSYRAITAQVSLSHEAVRKVCDRNEWYIKWSKAFEAE